MGREPARRENRMTVAITVVAVATAALAIHLSRYLPFIADDALISLRYARRLLDGQGLTWTDGERVEGYSNLLWVLACAALGRVGMDLITAARVLGIAGMVATIVAVVRVASPGSFAAALPAFAASLALPLASPIAVWTIGGLEQPLAAALLAWAIVLALPLLEERPIHARDALPAGIPLGLLCLTRPDGALFTAALAAGLLLARGFRRGTFAAASTLFVLPAIATLGQLLFRLSYYGDWLPNPARAKLGFSLLHLDKGASYLGGGALTLLPILIMAAAALLRVWDDVWSRRCAVFIATPLLTWAVYVGAIGGDFLPARRHMVPVVVLIALMIAAAGRASSSRPTSWVTWLAAAGVLVAFVVWQTRDVKTRRALEERWEWDCQVVGRMLGRGFGPLRPLVAVDPAGCLPYFSGLPSLDMIGLNDRYIARHPPADFGRGGIGHELGDGAYVLDRRPDLVVFCGPDGRLEPCFLSGRMMQQDPRFWREYIPVRFEGTDPYRVDSLIWVRWRDGPLGVSWENGRLVIPGWLFASNPKTRARLDSAGRMGAVSTPTQPVILRGIPIPAGRWAMHVEAGNRSLRTRVWRPFGGSLADGTDTARFVLDGEGDQPVVIEVAVGSGEESHVRRVVLEPDVARPDR
jgi:arabinofuranosyltransferase